MPFEIRRFDEDGKHHHVKYLTAVSLKSAVEQFTNIGDTYGYNSSTEAWVCTAKGENYLVRLEDINQAPIGFSIPNLDHLPDEDLAELGALFDLLSVYAIRKRSAVQARTAGQIRLAMALEDECQSMYAQLPEWARW